MAQVDVSKLVDKAREAVDRRNYDYAIEIYMNALRLDPDNAQARRDLRMAELRLAKERGTSLLGRIKLMYQLSKLQGLYRAKRNEAAMESAEECLRTDPTNVTALMVLARAARAAGHRNAAAATYEDIRAAKAGGNTKVLLEASRELAFLCEELGRTDMAKEVWQEVKRADPADPDADARIRDLYARDMTTRIETTVASGVRGAVARQMLKDTDQAERMTRDAGDIRTLQDVMAAIEDTRKDIQQRPDDARLYGKLGDLYRRAENYQEARKAYEQAIASDETNPHWRFKIDDLEIWKKGRELAELARKVRAGDAAAKQALEQGRAELLDFRLKSFLEREKQYSTDSRIRYELGMIFFELAEGKDDKALFDQAIQRFQIIYPDPNYRHEAGLRMGIGFARKGQFDLALKRFDEVIGPMEIKDLRWKNLVYAKADTLERAGRKEDALKTFLQIYEIDVGFKDVSDRVDKLHKEGVSMA